MGSFKIYPAIDLRGGQVVRLYQGDPHQQTIYGNDPATAARRWLEAGARWLHVVNLDGAFKTGAQPAPADPVSSGRQTGADLEPLGSAPITPNQAALQAILETATGFDPPGRVQFGGGLRSLVDIERALQAGVSRVVLGSLAVEAPEIAALALDQFGPKRIALGMDVRAGQVRIHGWTGGAAVDPIDLGRRFYDLGLRCCIYTEISRDGSGQGLDIEGTLRFARETGLGVIASGGVASMQDVQRARQAGLSGVIIGKALYDGKIDLREALQC